MQSTARQTVALVVIAISVVACGGGGPIPPTPSATPHKLPGPIHQSPVPVTTGTPASGSPASYLTAWPLPPLCPVSAADAPICHVPLAGGNRHASNGESILYRFGWGAATQQECKAFITSASKSITVDGRSVDLVTVPCQFFAASPVPGDGHTNVWVTDVRYVSSPLAPGQYNVSATITYHASLFDGIKTAVPSGTVQTFHMTLTVD